MQQIGTALLPPLEDVPTKADKRVRDFIATGLVIDIKQRPSSAKVLEDFPQHLGELPIPCIPHQLWLLTIIVQKRGQTICSYSKPQFLHRDLNRGKTKAMSK